MQRSIAVAALCCLISACGSGGASADAVRTGEEARRDALARDARDALALDQRQAEAGQAGNTVDTGAQYLASCTSFPSRCQAGTAHCGECQYRVRHRTTCAKNSPCDNLFLFWAFGGCEGVNIETMLDDVLQDNNDFVAACVQPLYPGEILPASLGAPQRESAVIAPLFARLRSGGDLGVWTGKNLLMGGCSHGASRYPVVAAGFAADADWLGSAKTAACLSEGVVSISVQDQFIGEMLASAAPSCAGRHQRVLEAYTVDAAVASHACAASPGGQCPCDPGHVFKTYPGSCGGGDCVTFDSIVQKSGATFAFSAGVSASSFAVNHWRLISEGSSYSSTPNRCQWDVVPEGPLEGLCSLLEADPTKTCSFVKQPDAKHCDYYSKNLNTLCVDWFRAL